MALTPPPNPFSNNPTTTNTLLGQGNTANLSDPASVNAAANAAVASSAQPYQSAALTSNGWVDQNGTAVPLKDATVGELQNNAFNPQLTPQTSFSYNPIQDNANTNQPYAPTVGYSDYTTQNAQAGQAGQLTQYPATAQANAGPGVDQNGYNTQATGFNASLGTAAQGTVDPNSMIQNQFKQIMNYNLDAHGVPQWAETATTAANQRMNSLGLGASTMAGNATAMAILNTALPMAAANAQVVAQLNSQNLSNSQQTMLSNQAYENAAAQFNATSQQQNNQFFASLTSGIATANANRDAAVSQFNAGEVNKSTQFYSGLNEQSNLENAQLQTQTNQFNVAQQNAMVQFLDNTNAQRAEFNSQNQLIVDQSNVQWQRAINTANTAGQNAANQANVQNTFNMQQTDLNNLWQQARDEASWSLTSSENSQNRSLSLVNSALNRQTSLDILNSQLQASMYSQLGSFGVNLLSGVLGGGSGANGLGGAISNGLYNLTAPNSSDGTFLGTSGGDFGGGSDSGIFG